MREQKIQISGLKKIKILQFIRVQKKKQVNEIQKLEFGKYEHHSEQIQQTKKMGKSAVVALDAVSPTYNSS